MQLRNNFLETIGHNDIYTAGPRTRSEPIAECRRFRVHLRDLGFINPVETRTICKSLDEEHELSDQLKNFGDVAKKTRQEYIMEVFYRKNPAPLFKRIPITKEEAIAQTNEANMTKNELIIKLESLLELTAENVRQKYRGFRSKNKSDLLIILQEVKYLLNEENEINNSDFVETSEITQ